MTGALRLTTGRNPCSPKRRRANPATHRPDRNPHRLLRQSARDGKSGRTMIAQICSTHRCSRAHSRDETAISTFHQGQRHRRTSKAECMAAILTSLPHYGSLGKPGASMYGLTPEAAPGPVGARLAAFGREAGIRRCAHPWGGSARPRSIPEFGEEPGISAAGQVRFISDLPAHRGSLRSQTCPADSLRRRASLVRRRACVCRRKP